MENRPLPREPWRGRITERSWRLNRECTVDRFIWDIDYAARVGESVHIWSGLDRSGQPLRVVWVAGRLTGQEFSAYEIAPCPNGNTICTPWAPCTECTEDAKIRDEHDLIAEHVASCAKEDYCFICQYL